MLRYKSDLNNILLQKMKAISFLFFISIIVLVSLKEQEKPKNGVRGIDVSQYQGEIDWGTVASSNVNYAIIR